jgi:hypothetical protein
MRRWPGRAWSLALPLLAPAAASAQTATASLTATTVVNNTALVIGQLNALDFGTVIPGIPSTIGPKSSPASSSSTVRRTPRSASPSPFPRCSRPG